VVLVSWITDGVWRWVQTTPKVEGTAPTASELLRACQDETTRQELADYCGLAPAELLWSLEHDVPGLCERTGMTLGTASQTPSRSVVNARVSTRASTPVSAQRGSATP
jgi:hypothetical protein